MNAGFVLATACDRPHQGRIPETKTLKKGDKVTLVGFGTFSVSKRAARTGRNPQTGKELKIPARKAPAFRAGKALKDAVNK